MTARFAELGYTADVAASQKLRSAAQFPWFKSNLFVMRRNVSLTTRRPGPGERERQTDRDTRARSISSTNWSALFQSAVMREPTVT